MAEKIVSPGVFTNEIDQSFIPAALGEIGAAIVGPTVKGPILEPTIVSSYGEYVQIFGELIQSGSSKYQYLTSHTAKEYLRQGGPLTVVRVASPRGDGAKATARVNLKTGAEAFTLEALGAGPVFNSVGTGSVGTNGLINPLTSSAGNNHYVSGAFGGRAENFRWDIPVVNTAKGTFTLTLRQGNDTNVRKQIIETHANLSFDPESSDFILKRIGNQTNTLVSEDGVAFLQPVGEYPNKSNFIRVSNLPEATKTDDYLLADGSVNSDVYATPANHFPEVGSGSYAGGFGAYTADGTQQPTEQTAGSVGIQNNKQPFAFYEDITATNSQGIDMAEAYKLPSGASLSTAGGYGAALSILSNKDEYEFNLLFLPGIIDGLANHGSVLTQAINLCEDRGDFFLVFDPSGKTQTVAGVKSTVEGRNSSFAAAYYPWVQIRDASLGVNRYVPPSTVIAGVYHFNDVVGQPWFAPAGLNRGGIDSAIQAYKKLSQANRDALYDSNVNPIATFPGQGVTVFGQKTTQKKASALDRVNVRRLLINIKSFVARSSRTLVFEQNTTDLRDQFLNTVNPYLEQVQSNAGLQAFEVVMDDTNNTPDTIDRNMLMGLIRLQPTKTAEFIVLDFTIEPSGAVFD